MREHENKIWTQHETFTIRISLSRVNIFTFLVSQLPTLFPHFVRSIHPKLHMNGLEKPCIACKQKEEKEGGKNMKQEEEEEEGIIF